MNQAHGGCEVILKCPALWSAGWGGEEGAEPGWPSGESDGAEGASQTAGNPNTNAGEYGGKRNAEGFSAANATPRIWNIGQALNMEEGDESDDLWWLCV